jgi:hypothetical protein
MVDMPFVMALQAVRLIMLLVVGPPVARWWQGRSTTNLLPRRLIAPDGVGMVACITGLVLALINQREHVKQDLSKCMSIRSGLVRRSH